MKSNIFSEVKILLYPKRAIASQGILFHASGLGSRTPDGSHLLAITISIIETCRIRKQSPWIYMNELITARRAGLPAPKLPKAVGV
jgi:hypothetical protein